MLHGPSKLLEVLETSTFRKLPEAGRPCLSSRVTGWIGWERGCSGIWICYSGSLVQPNLNHQALSPFTRCSRTLRQHVPVNNMLNLLPLSTAFSLYRSSVMVASSAIVRNRVTVTQELSQRLGASKLNTRSAFGQSVPQGASFEICTLQIVNLFHRIG